MKISILFVCMGNICRSPAAEGIFRQMVADAGLEDRIEIDSAGTHSYHVGRPADERMRRIASGRGYQLDSIARRLVVEDFERFDLVIPMDEDNFDAVMDLHPGHGAQVVPMVDYCEVCEVDEVPDPYYGGEEGFHTVIDILEDACFNLLKRCASLETP
ncbi:MAG TPA: low molecular weight protein-tyrosine-phosphatase [Xanthomonadales bacterium]|nr:low molecular weight protein-tyrosine-phosphatase [Xanthomonadales bacterium]